jgi:hypothetical protein
MRKMLLLAGLLLFVTSLAGAQTKMSGVASCGALNPVHSIPVGDTPGHSYAVAQGSCTWTTPWEIAGVKNAKGIGTQMHDVRGGTSKVHGTFVDTMANGDVAVYSFSFTLVTKGDTQKVMNHKWELLSGTGKIKGVKAKGSCKATPVAGSPGSWDYACEGEYSLPKS